MHQLGADNLYLKYHTKLQTLPDKADWRRQKETGDGAKMGIHDRFLLKVVSPSDRRAGRPVHCSPSWGPCMCWSWPDQAGGDVVGGVTRVAPEWTYLGLEQDRKALDQASQGRAKSPATELSNQLA